MKNTVLVTGVNGFVGKHLVRELSDRDIEVIGVGHSEAEADSSISPLLSEYYQCDLTKPEDVSQLPLEKISSVINLAGLANNGASFEQPDLYMKVNVEVLSVIGNLLLKMDSPARVVAVSTGALYDPNQPMPLSEDSKAIEAGSPYSLSKLAMEKTAEELSSSGLDCVVVRPFNHIGPGQEGGFLVPDLINKLKDIDGTEGEIQVGNLKTRRDYTDVRDIARAYADLVEAKTLRHKIYNVCSGKSTSGEQILETLQTAMGIDHIKTEVDPSKIRPNDPQEIFGDSSKLQSELGWRPEITLAQTIEDAVFSFAERG